MKITRVKLDNFTAFDTLDLALSPGINVIVGANGTGKTHLMKVAYASCDIAKSKLDYAEKLTSRLLTFRTSLGPPRQTSEGQFADHGGDLTR